MKRFPVPAVAAAVLVLSSCATRIPVSTAFDPAASLPAEAAAYLRAEHGFLEAAAQALLDPKDLKAVRPFLSKTEKAAAALVPADPSTRPDARFDLFGIAEGAYPAGAASFRLRVSKAWRREGLSLVRSEDGLRIAFAGKRLLAVGTRDLAPLLDRLSSPGPDPLPEDLRPLWEADAALWISRPGDLAGGILGTEGPSVPARGILLSLSPAPGGFAGTWVFDFASERDARVYAPVCRLAHLAFLRFLYADDREDASAALAGTAWSSGGGRLTASAFTIPGPALFTALARVLDAGSAAAW